jgi:acyl carrier protein
VAIREYSSRPRGTFRLRRYLTLIHNAFHAHRPSTATAIALVFSGASAFSPQQRLWGSSVTSRASPVLSATTEEQLIEIVAEQLGVEAAQVTNEANFAAYLGADSLDVVEMVMKIEEEFGVEIPDERAEEVQNLSDAVKLITELSS